MRLFLFSTILLLSFCKQAKQIKEIKNDKGIVVERFNTLPKSDIKHGPYEKYTDDGKLMEQATYDNGVLEGERKLYDAGILYSIEHRTKDAYEGKYISYYPNGQIDLEGFYENNTMTGEWKKYYKSGKIKEIVTFADNAENGPFTEYYENGLLKAKGGYKDGNNEHGPLELYDSLGVLERTMDCQNGVCKTTWKKE